MKKIRLHKYQSQAIRSRARFVAMVAGTGGGKTHTGAPWLAQEIEKARLDRLNGVFEGPASFLIASPTYKILQRATMPKVQELFRGSNLQGEYKEQKGQYILPGEDVIYCGSADRPETLEGVHVRAVWLDEAALMKRMAWIVAQARVGQSLGRILITTTPTALNWLYHEVYKRFVDGDKNYDVIQFSSNENPWYPDEEFERMKTTLDDRLFAMRYCGHFRKMAGLVYPDLDTSMMIDAMPKNIVEVRYGVDWGYSNPAVILVFLIDKDGVWWQVDEWCKSGKLIGEQIKVAKGYEETYGKGRFYCDPSEPAYIETFRQHGLDAVAADNSIAPGIQEVSTLIRTKRFRIIKEKCPNTIDEYETYHYPEEGSKDIPVKEGDHCMDATRYTARGEKAHSVPEEIVYPDDIGEDIEEIIIGSHY